MATATVAATAALPQEATDTLLPGATPPPASEATDAPVPGATETPLPVATPTPEETIPPSPVVSVSVDGQLVLPGSPVTAQAGQAITFDGSASQSGSSPIASYEWDFGDGNTGAGATVSHAYSNEGGFEVTLTVTDENGLPNTEVIGVQITAAGQ